MSENGIEIEAKKREIRAQVKARLSQAECSSDFCAFFQTERMMSTGLFSRAVRLVGFIPYKMEPDILPILKEWLKTGKELWLPSYDAPSGQYALSRVQGFDDTWLVPGKYGISEPRPQLPRMYSPFPLQDGDIWLVPGIAFSSDGVRLGRGGGYYDRMLLARGIKIGITYDLAIWPGIPSMEHDIPMDYLLTETRFIQCV